MIYIDGVPFSAESEASNQGKHLLSTLIKHPVLVSSSSSFNVISERKFTVLEDFVSDISGHSKCVYIFQREYATVDPALVDFVGTDEATTCIGLVIRNRASGMISVAHMDSPKVVNAGLTQMLSSVVNQDSFAELDVHLVGGFDDVSPQHPHSRTRSGSNSKAGGYSFPLCTKIVETLHKSSKRFHLRTLHVLEHNTRRDSNGNAAPIFHGFMVETSTGSLFPASFDENSRCPDEIVRRIRLTACSENLGLLETYETRTDRFILAPFFWTNWLVKFALAMQQLSDSEILLSCSTSPSAESPHFVENERRLFEYLIRNPDWRDMFPAMKPRIHERIGNTWIRQMAEIA